MSQPRKTCRKCGETLHYEGIGGMRLYRVENGRRIYRARCPGCSLLAYGKLAPKPRTQKVP